MPKTKTKKKKKKTTKQSEWFRIVCWCVAVIVVFCLIGGIIMRREKCSNNDEVRIFIPTGTTYDAVVDTLVANGCLSSREGFDAMSRLRHYPNHVKAGSYIVDAHMPYFDLVNKLRAGNQDAIRIVIGRQRSMETMCRNLGNRFEFRAVGSSANCAGAITTLNAAVAGQLKDFMAGVDAAMAGGKSRNEAVTECLKPLAAEVLDTVCFDGNGYTDEWKEEAAKRGLDTETCVPKMFLQFTTPETLSLFSSAGIFTERELEARNEVNWSRYINKVGIEARMMGRMVTNHIVPAVQEYKRVLLEGLSLEKDVFGDSLRDSATRETVRSLVALLEEVRTVTVSLDEALSKADSIGDEFEKAVAYHGIAQLLEEVRKPVDRLEEITDNALWPLPKYREILMIS